MDKNKVILNVGKTEEYAVGLTRQMSVTRDLHGDVFGETDESLHGTTGGEVRDRSKPDQAVCLFQKDSSGRC